jgi:hypothetical protein
MPTIKTQHNRLEWEGTKEFFVANAYGLRYICGCGKARQIGMTSIHNVMCWHDFIMSLA